ncbi:MAG: hypothetical protein ACJ8EY_02605 [Sphingomicrobium sp.]
MRATLTAIGLGLLISACEQSPKNPVKPRIVGSEGQQRLHQLNEMDRAITFKRAIYASGFACKRIERSGYVQEYGNLSMWTAHCSDKRNWAIYVGPDESVQVRPCEQAAELKLPACVITDEAASPARP